MGDISPDTMQNRICLAKLNDFLFCNTVSYYSNARNGRLILLRAHDLSQVLKVAGYPSFNRS